LINLYFIKHIENFVYYVKFIVEKLLLPAVNPLKTQLNPICHLLALLGAHHILHVSEIRIKFAREEKKPVKHYATSTGIILPKNALNKIQ